MTGRRPAAAVLTAAALATAISGLVPSASAAPTRRFSLPAGTLTLATAQIGASRQQPVSFTVALTRRAVRSATLELTLPRLWVSRSGVSGLAYATVPTRGRGPAPRVRVRRRARVVRWTFAGARRDDAGTFTVTDVGLPARTYRLPYRWREAGRASASGTATVVVAASPR